MSEQTTTMVVQPNNVSPVSEEQSPTSPLKSEIDMKKDKKKKQKNLQQFLSKPESQIIDVPRRAQQQTPEEKKQERQNETNCKICGELSQKRKQCEFCKDTVCNEHIRKRRKYKNTPKFVRICDDCQDKYLYDKYMKLQNKAEEAIVMQQMILQSKRNELAELAGDKNTRIQVLLNKKKELEQQKKENDHKNRISQNDLANKLKKMDVKQNQNLELSNFIKKLEEELPRPLDDDYNCLLEQNNKITKELVKFQKLCSEALKAKSTRQKQLYEAYYNWEKKEAGRANAKKKEECTIY